MSVHNESAPEQGNTVLPHFSSVVITGASSGIGMALAKAYAADGVTLALLGRDSERLGAVAEACVRKGARCIIASLDVTDAEAMKIWLRNHDLAYPVDLVIANAGISGGTSGEDGETEEQVRRIFDVNFNGVLNTIFPLIPLMKSRRKGQIALVSSLAGLRGLSGAPAYSASKGVIRLYGEGMRAILKPYGIAVSVICPGFVRTPMTDINPFPMPFLMSADDAARRIQRGIARKEARIAFPWPMYALVWLLALLPVAMGDFLLGILPSKPAIAPNARRGDG